MTFRLARESEHAAVRAMIVEAFDPITWMRRVDAEFGPFNGIEWRERFGRRVDPLLARGIALVGVEAGEELAAAAAGSYDAASGTGVVDFLAVDARFQGQGHGRAMLRAMLAHLQSLGATTATLECLTTNEPALALYRSEGWTEIASQVRFFRRLDGTLEK